MPAGPDWKCSVAPACATFTPSGFVLPLSSRALQPAGRVPPPCIFAGSCCICASTAAAPRATNAAVNQTCFIAASSALSLLRRHSVILQAVILFERAGRQRSGGTRLRRLVTDGHEVPQVHDDGVAILRAPVRERAPRHHVGRDDVAVG